MSRPNIYEITLEHNGQEIVVDDIWLTADEGDWNEATTLAIGLLRDEGLRGEIKYLSHSVH